MNYNWFSWVEYNDLYTFNLFGDPSLTLEGINIGGRPDKPSTPLGPTSGKTGEEYTYSSSTTDSNGDEIYYLFDWGDGADSGWLGPFVSGEPCEANYIWGKRGSYEIKVKAKDINGMMSEWSDPLPVSMPKTYENPFWALIEKLFNWLEEMFGKEMLLGIFNF
jgi:hypothetical protein